MIPEDVGVLHFRRGLASLQMKFFDEAITSFDKAAHYGDESLRICHSRASVLASLRSVWLACENGRDVESLSETELFESLSRLPEPIQVALLFPSPSPSLSHKSQLDLAQPLLHRRRLQRNLIDFLPNEILSDIGRLLVEDRGSSDVAFPLAAVSTRWRTIFRTDPVMWELAHLSLNVFGRDRRLKKLQALTEPSNARIRELTLADSRDATELVSEVVRRGEQLRSLKVECGRFLDSGMVWKLLGAPSNPSPFLRSLSIDRPYRSLLDDLPPPAILSNLQTLSLRTQSHPSSIYPLLQLLPNLRTLELAGHFHLLLPGSDDTSSLTLPHLTSLRISTTLDHRGIEELVQYNFPNLAKLDLSECLHLSYPSYIFPSRAALPLNNLHLTHLSLRGCVLPTENVFIEHLHRLPNLLLLELGNNPRTAGNGRITDATMLALTRPGEGDVAGEAASEKEKEMVGEGACPLLEVLDLHRLGSASSVLRLVRSRLVGGSKLRKFSVARPSRFEEDELRWIRERVDDFAMSPSSG